MKARNAVTLGSVGQYLKAMDIIYNNTEGYPSPTPPPSDPRHYWWCLGKGPCGGNGENAGLLTEFSPYIVGTPAANSVLVNLGLSGFMGSIYVCYSILNNRCTQGIILYHLEKQVNCGYGDIRTIINSNTRCMHNFP